MRALSVSFPPQGAVFFLSIFLHECHMSALSCLFADFVSHLAEPRGPHGRQRELVFCCWPCWSVYRFQRRPLQAVWLFSVPSSSSSQWTHSAHQQQLSPSQFLCWRKIICSSLILLCLLTLCSCACIIFFLQSTEIEVNRAPPLLFRFSLLFCFLEVDLEPSIFFLFFSNGQLPVWLIQDCHASYLTISSISASICPLMSLNPLL